VELAESRVGEKGLTRFAQEKPFVVVTGMVGFGETISPGGFGIFKD